MESITVAIWLAILAFLLWLGHHDMLMAFWGVLVALVVLSSVGSMLWAICLAVLRIFD